MLMIHTMNDVAYKAFGLTISSDFVLPELPQMEIEGNNIDVVVTKADLVDEWLSTDKFWKYYSVTETVFMIKIPGVAICKVENGKAIFVSPIEGSNEDQIRLYILGTCMGAILMQRRILPLHGSAIAINGKAYAIVGESGAGKSTLASAFMERGYRLLSDDVIALSITEKNIPMVTPAYPHQKLWQESLDHFGMESDQLQSIYNRETKYAVPVIDHFEAQQLPLAGVFELTKTESDAISLSPIQNLERFPLLLAHTYRNFLISRSGLMEWHFGICTAIVNQIKVYQLCRPTTRFTTNELVELIVNEIK